VSNTTNQKGGSGVVPITFPWHSSRPGETVYHNNTFCKEGNNIEIYYRTPGTGFGLKLCTHCAMWNALGR
jgi:hypothetical protein